MPSPISCLALDGKTSTAVGSMLTAMCPGMTVTWNPWFLRRRSCMRAAIKSTASQAHTKHSVWEREPYLKAAHQ